MKRIELLIALHLAGLRRSEDDAYRRRENDFGLHGDLNGLADEDKTEHWYRQDFNRDIRKRAREAGEALKWFIRAALAVFFLMGIGAAAAAFYYDGQRPINVLPVLFLFVFLPPALLMLSIIRQLWLNARSAAGKAPETAGIVAIWEAVLLKVTGGKTKPAGVRSGKEDMLSTRPDEGEQKRAVFGKVTVAHLIESSHDLVRTLILRTIQLAGLAYIAGALLWVMFHVITTDLAFSWSSTLNMGPQHMYAITEAISAPWRDWLPGAVVDYETVERTRYYRAWPDILAEGITARDLTGWWPFLLMSVLTWGFIPRLAALIWYQIRFSRKLSVAINDLRGELMQFIYTPAIRSLSDSSDNTRHWQPADEDEPSKIEGLPASCILMWNFGEYDPDMEKIKMRFGIKRANIYSLGGSNSLAEDEHIISRVAADLKEMDPDQHLIILVELWESPDVDFTRMLGRLRPVIGKKLIRIVPVSLSGESGRISESSNWHNYIRHTGDPLLRFDPEAMIVIEE